MPNFDDFDTTIQSDEIIPEEYEDWLRYCARAYEASEEEKYDEPYSAYDEDGRYEFEPGKFIWDEAAANP